MRLKQRGKSQATVSLKEQAMPKGLHSLYRLTDDPGEQKDLSAEKPEIVQQMTEMLDKLIADGRSRQ